MKRSKIEILGPEDTFIFKQSIKTQIIEVNSLNQIIIRYKVNNLYKVFFVLLTLFAFFLLGYIFSIVRYEMGVESVATVFVGLSILYYIFKTSFFYAIDQKVFFKRKDNLISLKSKIWLRSDVNERKDYDNVYQASDLLLIAKREASFSNMYNKATWRWMQFRIGSINSFVTKVRTPENNYFLALRVKNNNKPFDINLFPNIPVSSSHCNIDKENIEKLSELLSVQVIYEN